VAAEGTSDIDVDLNPVLAPCAFVGGCHPDQASFWRALSMVRRATL